MTDFGYSTIATAGNDNPSNNWIWLKATSTPASNGTLDSISVYCATFSQTPTLSCALYTDNAGVPGSKIAGADGDSLTPATVSSASFSWVTQSGFSASITAATQYWFGIRIPNNGDAGRPDFNVKYDTNGSATEGYYKDAGLPNGSFPANGSGATGFTNERWSVYGSYTASAGAQDTPELYGRPAGRSGQRQMHQLLAT